MNNNMKGMSADLDYIKQTHLFTAEIKGKLTIFTLSNFEHRKASR
jgi:hypothetical protein